MFTGIIQDVGRIERTSPRSSGRRLTVSTSLDTSSFELGESVAVNGVCLTAADLGKGTFDADASPETLLRSTLGDLRPGALVNLERALRPVDRLGGHFVLGHVDATAKMDEKRREGDFWVLRFEAPASVERYLVEKGSVAVDGISLTVSACGARAFSVAVIPHTLERTTLRGCRVGDRVNLEADILGKYVEKLLGDRRRPEGLSLEALARSGFLR